MEGQVEFHITAPLTLQKWEYRSIVIFELIYPQAFP